MTATPLAPSQPHTRAAAAGADPSLVYQTFLTAIGARDLPGVLACMTGHYGFGLSQHYRHSKFCQFFELWCGIYPSKADVVAWFIDGDTATLEVANEINGVVVASHVGLAIERGAWRVAWERFEGGRNRLHLHTATPEATAHESQSRASRPCPRRRVGDHIGSETDSRDFFPHYATG